MFVSETTAWIIFVLVGALVAWRLYARARRLIGRQRLSLIRIGATLAFMPVAAGVLAILATVLSVSPGANPGTNLLSLLAGVAAGIGIARIGLHLTRFEIHAGELFYTPNAALGIALMLLLIGRLAYRMFMSYLANAPVGEIPRDLLLSPLTLAILGLLVGYYFAYAIGLLRWRRTTRNQVSMR